MYNFNKNKKPNGSMPQLKLNTQPQLKLNVASSHAKPLNIIPQQVQVTANNPRRPISLSITNAYSPTQPENKSPLVFSNEILNELGGSSSNSSSSTVNDLSSGMGRLNINHCSRNENVISSTKAGLTTTLPSMERQPISEPVPDSEQKPKGILKSVNNGNTNSLLDKPMKELSDEDWQQLYFNNEFVELAILGEGSGGSVSKCTLKHEQSIFALKTIVANPDQEIQKQITRELKFNKSCDSPYIVKYFGAFLDERNSRICIAMEYMGGKSLDATYKRINERGGRIGEKVLGKIAESILRGLSYLYTKKIIHRDVKPQNILLNHEGEVKLCDFGVSGNVINSLASTFTGTSFYMAPERIRGDSYSITSDVWSLGVTLLEVAKGRFPFYKEGSDEKTTAPIELISMIISYTPELKDEPGITWSSSFRSFINYCLVKDPKTRASPRQMLEHPWIKGQMKKNVKMDVFVQKCWEED